MDAEYRCPTRYLFQKYQAASIYFESSVVAVKSSQIAKPDIMVMLYWILSNYRQLLFICNAN